MSTSQPHKVCVELARGGGCVKGSKTENKFPPFSRRRRPPQLPWLAWAWTSLLSKSSFMRTLTTKAMWRTLSLSTSNTDLKVAPIILPTLSDFKARGRFFSWTHTLMVRNATKVWSQRPSYSATTTIALSKRHGPPRKTLSRTTIVSKLTSHETSWASFSDMHTTRWAPKSLHCTLEHCHPY